MLKKKKKVEFYISKYVNFLSSAPSPTGTETVSGQYPSIYAHHPGGRSCGQLQIR